MEPAAAKSAATVLLVRDSSEGPQLYMVKRHHASEFMANAYVFPGGAVDEEDASEAIAGRCDGDDERRGAALGTSDLRAARALYVAALREAFEEAGVLVAEPAAGAGEIDAARLPELRARLNAGTLGFAALLEALDARLPLDRLRYLAHWITPTFQPKRFDARFFVCRAPAAQEAEFDRRETTAGGWFTSAELLDANSREEKQLPPPTLCVLEDLAPAESAEEVLAAAPDRPVSPICPQGFAAKELTLLLPGDHRFDDPDSAAGPEHYVALRGRRWVRVRS